MSEIKISPQLLFAMINCKDAKSALEVLKNAGYDVTEEEADSFLQSLENRELTDEELDLFTGGGTRRHVQVLLLDKADYEV